MRFENMQHIENQDFLIKQNILCFHTITVHNPYKDQDTQGREIRILGFIFIF